jgi:hypothetical protein
MGKLTSKDIIGRVILHIPVGVLNAWFYYKNPYMGLGLTLAFIAYEVLDEWRSADKSWKDAFGWLIGFAVMGAIL